VKPARTSAGGDEDQSAEVPTVVRDRKRRARSARERRELTVTPGPPGSPADLRTGRLIRCANAQFIRFCVRSGWQADDHFHINHERMGLLTG
jgi:hypothetical protein